MNNVIKVTLCWNKNAVLLNTILQTKEHVNSFYWKFREDLIALLSHFPSHLYKHYKKLHIQRKLIICASFINYRKLQFQSLLLYYRNHMVPIVSLNHAKTTGLISMKIFTKLFDTCKSNIYPLSLWFFTVSR